MIPSRRHRLPYLVGIGLIAHRDLRTILRSVWVAVLMAVLVAIVGGGAILGMPRGSGASTSVSAYARYGYFFYQTYLYVIALFVVPALGAVAIAGERKENTLEQLRISCLSCGQIVLGKSAALLALYFLLCSATFPLAGMVYFFAGVDLQRMLRLPFWLGPFAMLCAVTGVFMALRWRDVIGTTLKTAALVLVMSSPPLVFVMVATSGFVMSWQTLMIGTTLCMLLCTLLSFLGARRMLRVEERREGEPELGPVLTPNQRPFRPMAPRESKRVRSIRDEENPVHAKELWCHQLLDGAYTGRMVVAGVLLGLFSVAPAMNGSSNAFLFESGGPGSLCMLLIVPAIMVQLINQERESGTLIQLQTSLLSARDVLWGKVSALVRAVIPFMIGVLILESFTVLTFTYAVTLDGYALETAALLFRSFSRLPLYLLLIACCTLPGALFARNAQNAFVAGYGGAVLGALLYRLLRGPLISLVVAAVATRGSFRPVDFLLISVQDIVLLTLLAGSAFALACRLYRRG